MLSLPLRAFLTLALTSLAAGQGLVQISLGGELTRRGGSRVELAVGAKIDGQARQVELDIHLAQGTSSSDFAQLVAARLSRAGFDVLAPMPREAQAAKSHVFVENTYFVRMRLGGGLIGTITTSELAPSEVRVDAPESMLEPANLLISASTRSPHTKKYGRSQFAVEFAKDDHPAQAINKIHKAALTAEWLGDRPTAHAWRPVRLVDGSIITGFSIGLESAGDWRLEVTLPRGDR
ncbi:MAG: hypothetical protein GY711_30200 [bacterium]|nr:hypothetical protein [bacterium]